MTKPIRAVVAGAKEDMLKDLLQTLIERNVSFVVVGQTSRIPELAGLARDTDADLAVVCETRKLRCGDLDAMREGLGERALVVVDGRGHEVWALRPEPGLADLARMIATACRRSDLSGLAGGQV